MAPVMHLVIKGDTCRRVKYQEEMELSILSEVPMIGCVLRAADSDRIVPMVMATQALVIVSMAWLISNDAREVVVVPTSLSTRLLSFTPSSLLALSKKVPSNNSPASMVATGNVVVVDTRGFLLVDENPKTGSTMSSKMPRTMGIVQLDSIFSW